MSAVGHASNPWQVQAELISPPSGVKLLEAGSTVPFIDGTATFGQLMVSGVGTGLRLRFTVTQPSNVSFSVEMPGSFETTEKKVNVRPAGNARANWQKPGERIRYVSTQHLVRER